MEPYHHRISRKELARFIEHTLLRPDVKDSDIERVCEEAVRFNFVAVCIPPFYTSLASGILKHSGVKACTVVGFPFGYNFPESKSFEAARAVENGADELDMVINITALKSGVFTSVCKDIGGVVSAAKGRKVKVIIETCYLSRKEKIKACECAVKSGAAFVKTSTGLGTSGASIEDVRLMCRLVPEGIGVKAAGGIRDLKTALAMIEAGAKRIGTSAGVELISEIQEGKKVEVNETLND
ncbi:MAG: deoxyribose-phosphate aldolase [Candidatus Scalinduaceae bacterium]